MGDDHGQNVELLGKSNSLYPKHIWHVHAIVTLAEDLHDLHT